MATEKQIMALEKWLQVDIEDMDFDTCSDYLDMLHNASEEYNADKNKKGIVKQTKEAILNELRKTGKITRPAGEQKLDSSADAEPKRGLDPAEWLEKKRREELERQRSQNVEPARTDLQLEEAHAQAEVIRMGTVMKFCVVESQRIAEELCNGGVTEGTKAGLIQKLSTTLFIEAMRRGL